MLRQEIETLILTVNNQFHRHGAWCPAHTKVFTDDKSGFIAQETQVVICMSYQAPMLVTRHAEHLLLAVQFDTVGFLVKTVPGPVSTSFELSCGVIQRIVTR